MPKNKSEIEGAAPVETLDIHQILNYLPHRYPFLLVDRVMNFTLEESLTAIKNVSYNEPYFQGHFPVRPIMPGVLILEALAQATGILAFLTMDAKPSDGVLYYLIGIDNARFKLPVTPGDQLLLNVRRTRAVRNIWTVKAEATVDEKLVASADIMCAAKEIED